MTARLNLRAFIANWPYEPEDLREDTGLVGTIGGVQAMGITCVDGIARGADGQEQTVRFMVDSGAKYTLLPKPVWESLGLTPSRELTFVLADGATVERGVSECYLILPQGQSHSPVILGEDDDAALLGVVTLEILGLVLNPFNRTLQPMRMTHA